VNTQFTRLQLKLHTPDLFSFCDNSDLKQYGLNEAYLNRMDKTIENALSEHSRTLAVRVDLHLPIFIFYDELDRDLPNNYHHNESNLISRFINSFKAKIKADFNRKYKQRNRVHHCSPRFIWCRERDTAINDHFHIVILLNKDTYHGLGYYGDNDNLSSMIIEAWKSALNYFGEEVERLIHFPKNPCYYIDKNHEDYHQQLEALFRRVSYLAKKRTKCYGEGKRSFGVSSR